MSVWKGNTTSTVTSSQATGSYNIVYFVITNKTAGSVVINLSIVQQVYPGTQNISIAPLNLTLAIGESYTDEGIEILGGESVELTVTGGNVDYYFYANP